MTWHYANDCPNNTVLNADEEEFSEFDYPALSKASAGSDGQSKKPRTSYSMESLAPMSDLLLPAKQPN